MNARRRGGAGRRAASGPSPVFAERRAGLLLPLASLPGGHGVGDLGPAAHAFLDWCAAAGVGWWQMLPVGPLGGGDSPYAARSALAGEPLYVSLDLLAEDGWLEPRELLARPSLSRGPIDYAAARAFKEPLLALAHGRWRAAGGARRAEFRRFAKEHGDWLAGWLDHEAARSGAQVRPLAEFLQFQFVRQWQGLRRRATDRGVRLLGDLPIFVGLDSADVRAHPELFRLRRDGTPQVVTGVPPDGYSADGQVWNHPHYRWPAHRATDFAWWRRRVAVELQRFDALRVDHFIGFHHAWEVPGGAPHARDGRWGRTPGERLLAALQQQFGPLPMVAEDLGAVSPPVLALRDAFGLPGMRVLQFGFGGGSYDRPHNHPRHCLAYTGTHDNPTTVGWWRTLGAPDRARLRDYLGLASPRPTARAAATALLAALWSSPAGTAVAPLQDLLGLDDRARTNVPGTARGNWSWRLADGALTAPLAATLRAHLELTDRVPRG